MRHLKIALVLASLGLSACSKSSGTFLIVKISKGAATPSGITKLEINLGLSGKTATIPLQESGGGEIAFPTDDTIELNSGSGALSVSVVAKGATGTELDRGSSSGTITRGETTTVNVVLGANMMMVDGGMGDGSPGDGGGTPNLMIDPTSHDFGSAQVMTNGSNLSFTVTNSGTAASPALTAALTGADASSFMMVTDGCSGMTLSPAATCMVNVLFKPSAVGARAAMLTITGANGQVASLTGTGLAASALAIAPATGHDFGDAIKGTAGGTFPFMVTNTGGVASGALSVRLTGSDAGEFNNPGSGSCVGAMLPPGGTCMVPVQFMPTTTGVKSATFEVTGTPGGTVPVTVTGRGINGAGLAITAGAAHDFGPLDVGMTAQSTVTITNTGDQTTGAITTTIPANPDFTVTDGCTGMMLVGGGTCNIVITFGPRSFGAKTLAITATATPGSTVTTTLTGTGRDTITVTLTTTGSGTGTITSVPAGTCVGNTCTFTRTTMNPMVTFTANPSVTSTFTSWTVGPCATSTMPVCAAMLTGPVTLTASFAIQTFPINYTKRVIGTGAGTVTSAPAGINCGAGCTTQAATFNSGMSVTLTAVPTSGFFGGWSGDCTGFQLTCTVSVTRIMNVGATFSSKANTVFVSSFQYTMGQLATLGTVGGTTQTTAEKVLLGGNKACTSLASGTAFAGTYVAWMSNSSTTATARLGTARGWVRPDGKPFADSVQSLAAGQIYYPNNTTELNSATTGAVWTFSNPDGSTFSGYNCNDLGSNLAADHAMVGFREDGTRIWIAGYNQTCDTSASIYCFQTDNQVVVPAPIAPSPARVIFYTNNAFDSARGIPAADALCNQEAGFNPALAGLSFRALLATSTASIASRFTTRGVPVVRTDGVIVDATDTDLLSNAALTAPIDVSADGSTYSGGTSIWSGASTVNQAQALGGGYTCQNWTVNVGGTMNNGGISGATGYVGSSWINQGTPFCNASGGHLYCLQQP